MGEKICPISLHFYLFLSLLLLVVHVAEKDDNGHVAKHRCPRRRSCTFAHLPCKSLLAVGYINLSEYNTIFNVPPLPSPLFLCTNSLSLT